MKLSYAATLVFCFVALLSSSGCNQKQAAVPTEEVVIYSSVDEPDLTPILKEFEGKTGIKVRAVTDTEATKTAVLVQKLEAEKDNPQADVYWGNEIFHTINLAEHGFFEPYRPQTAEDVPAKWRGSNDLYTCIGVRARVIAFSTRPEYKDLVSPLHHLRDLGNPALKDKIGFCHPGFGTASGHFAAMYVLLGEPKYIDFMKALRANNMKLLGGNSAVADEIIAGNLAAGPTDNDDVSDGKEQKQPIDGVIPDQGSDEPGTLLIPGSIALMHGAKHPDAAKKLIDFLASTAIEKELIDAHYIGYSVRGPISVKAMDVNYTECAHNMRHAIELALGILQDRK